MRASERVKGGALERNASAGTLVLRAMGREREREKASEREREREPPRGDKVSQHQCQV